MMQRSPAQDGGSGESSLKEVLKGFSILTGCGSGFEIPPEENQEGGRCQPLKGLENCELVDWSPGHRHGQEKLERRLARPLVSEQKGCEHWTGTHNCPSSLRQ